jgi:hypothetical protein
MDNKNLKLSKKVKITVGLLIAIASFITLSVLPKFIQAQTDNIGQSLEISPPSQDVTANPGETILVKAKVRNTTAKALPINVRIEDFIASGNEGQVALTEKGPWAVSTWTSVAPSQFTLNPGESKEVTGSISVPRAGAGGGRYGSFVFSVAAPAGQPGVAAVSQEVASLFLVNISGPKEEKIAISSFSAPSFMEFGPVPFTVTYKNTGNVHLKPVGEIGISNIVGGKSADIAVDGVNVFPGADRVVKTNWNQKILIGKYTATAVIYTGSSKNDTMVATTTFTVFPIRFAAIGLLLIVVLYLLRKRIAKAFTALAGK